LKIVVTGGAGATGQCAVRDLLRNRSVERVRVGDSDLNALGNLQDKLKVGKDRLDFGRIDVTNREDTVSFLKGFDFVINAVQYYHNLSVMSAALEAKVSYLDFGGLFYTTLRQIRDFDRSFKEAGIIGIAGMGAQPGVTNLMVKSALSTFDRADSVEIFDGWRDMSEGSSPISFTWSPLTFFDESSKEAIVFQNGKYVTHPPFSEPERIWFPKPVGEVEVFLALHSEIATIPKSFAKYGLKKVSWKEGGTDLWKIKFLGELGLTSDEKVQYNGAKISPRKFLLTLLDSRGILKSSAVATPNDFEITRVIVKGRSKRKKKKIVVDAFFPPYRPWKVSCSQYNVGIPGSIAAQMIANKKVTKAGVFPAEQVFEPRDFFKELHKRGIRIRHRVFEI
jgi:lysine 6-dehydrogenase